MFVVNINLCLSIKLSETLSTEIISETTIFNQYSIEYNKSLSLDDEGERLFDGYSQELLSFASAMCIIFILMGVPGNLITIIALTRCKKVSLYHVLIF